MKAPKDRVEEIKANMTDEEIAHVEKQVAMGWKMRDDLVEVINSYRKKGLETRGVESILVALSVETSMRLGYTAEENFTRNADIIMGILKGEVEIYDNPVDDFADALDRITKEKNTVH